MNIVENLQKVSHCTAIEEILSTKSPPCHGTVERRDFYYNIMVNAM